MRATISLDVPVTSIQSCMSRRWRMVSVLQAGAIDIAMTKYFYVVIFSADSHCTEIEPGFLFSSGIYFLFFRWISISMYRHSFVCWGRCDVWQIEMWCYLKYDFFFRIYFLVRYFSSLFAKDAHSADDAFFPACRDFSNVFASSSLYCHVVLVNMWIDMNGESGFHSTILFYLSIHTFIIDNGLMAFYPVFVCVCVCGECQWWACCVFQ